MNIRIDQFRLEKDLADLGKIGATLEGGVSRRPFTPEDQEGRLFVMRRMEDAGLKIRIDEAGNIHGTRLGKRGNESPVMTGSHVDTVENGGQFDGAVGVIGAIEVMRALNDAGVETDYNLEVVSFLSEEPNRFNTTTVGSRFLSGKLTNPKILDRMDQNGMTLAQALVDYDINPAKVFDARYSPGDIRAFVELHVEQGNTLYAKKVPIGIVTDIVAGYRYRVAFHGQADHSGTTPMGQRKDALAAAAEAILLVERICEKYSDKDIVGTVGIIHSKPGMMNVVPGYAEILIDIRGRAHFPKTKPAEEIQSAISEIGKRRRITVNIETLMEEESPVLSERIIEVIRQCVERRGFPYSFVPSRAGHDAMHFVSLTDVGMIFVPSKDGISHAPDEWTDIEDVGKGVTLLADTLVRLATDFGD